MICIIAPVAPGIIAGALKSHDGRIPEIQHPSFECLEILGFPSLIVTHQFCSLCKFISIKTSCKSEVSVATDTFAGVGPSHQYINGMFGARFISFYLPTECILISDGCTTGSIDIILTRATATDDGFYWPCCTGRLCKFCILQDVISLGHLLITGSQLCLDAFEVGIGMQTSRMAETTVGIIGRHQFCICEN